MGEFGGETKKINKFRAGKRTQAKEGGGFLTVTREN